MVKKGGRLEDWQGRLARLLGEEGPGEEDWREEDLARPNSHSSGFKRSPLDALPTG